MDGRVWAARVRNRDGSDAWDGVGSVLLINTHDDVGTTPWRMRVGQVEEQMCDGSSLRCRQPCARAPVPVPECPKILSGGGCVTRRLDPRESNNVLDLATLIVRLAAPSISCLSSSHRPLICPRPDGHAIRLTRPACSRAPRGLQRIRHPSMPPSEESGAALSTSITPAASRPQSSQGSRSGTSTPRPSSAMDVSKSPEDSGKLRTFVGILKKYRAPSPWLLTARQTAH